MDPLSPKERPFTFFPSSAIRVKDFGPEPHYGVSISLKGLPPANGCVLGNGLRKSRHKLQQLIEGQPSLFPKLVLKVFGRLYVEAGSPIKEKWSQRKQQMKPEPLLSFERFWVEKH